MPDDIVTDSSDVNMLEEHLAIVNAEKDSQMSCAHNPSVDVLEAARDAWTRLQDRAHPNFTDWLIVGAALAAIRTDAMVAATTNRPEGHRYCREFGVLLREAGLGAIDKGCRSRLLKILEHRDEIEMWLAKLEPAKRLKLNHPQPVWTAWSKAMGLGTPKPEPKSKSEPESKSKPKPKPELVVVWKNASKEERRAVLDDGGVELLCETLSQEQRTVLTKRLKPTKAADEILGERIRNLVDEIRALAAHYEQNKDAINTKYAAIKRATRGAGRAPSTTPPKTDPVVAKAIRAIGNDVDAGETAAAMMAAQAAADARRTDNERNARPRQVLALH